MLVCIFTSVARFILMEEGDFARPLSVYLGGEEFSREGIVPLELHSDVSLSHKSISDMLKIIKENH